MPDDCEEIEGTLNEETKQLFNDLGVKPTQRNVGIFMKYFNKKLDEYKKQMIKVLEEFE
jgi:hypothetical protein